jgi:hypothetical protein
MDTQAGVCRNGGTAGFIIHSNTLETGPCKYDQQHNAVLPLSMGSGKLFFRRQNFSFSRRRGVEGSFRYCVRVGDVLKSSCRFKHYQVKERCSSQSGPDDGLPTLFGGTSVNIQSGWAPICTSTSTWVTPEEAIANQLSERVGGMVIIPTALSCGLMQIF